jgi:hypothetical protein
MNEIPEITFDAFIGAMNLEKEFEAETIVQETIECPICMEINNDRLYLKCGHHLCKQCMLLLVKKSINVNKNINEQNNIKCSICRQFTEVDYFDFDLHQFGFAIALLHY